jgi:hypothetical protein
MRRLLFVAMLVVVAIGLTAGSAAAGSIRVRIDRNDSSSNLDIHRVTTKLSATTMYLRLGSWDRFRIRDMRETWGFALDTVGDQKFDRWVGIYPSPHGLKCEVRDRPHGVHLVGTRHATRPDRRSAACHLPRGWFGPFDKAIRFRAFIEEPSSPRASDNAPNHGRYHGI